MVTFRPSCNESIIIVFCDSSVRIGGGKFDGMCAGKRERECFILSDRLIFKLELHIVKFSLRSVFQAFEKSIVFSSFQFAGVLSFDLPH